MPAIVFLRVGLELRIGGGINYQGYWRGLTPFSGVGTAGWNSTDRSHQFLEAHQVQHALKVLNQRRRLHSPCTLARPFNKKWSETGSPHTLVRFFMVIAIEFEFGWSFPSFVEMVNRWCPSELPKCTIAEIALIVRVVARRQRAGITYY